MKRVLTALQPSGVLHIGNLFGAIEPLIKLQNEGNDNILFVVDYHAITVEQDPKELRKNILFGAAAYLAAGVDPEKTILFQQSKVSQHTELSWVLNCLTHMGELERMTQYKDKAKGKKEVASVGLFSYPVLMAADILLYDTQVVPVGEDQKQHVELARDLAQRFNNRFGETFTVPTPQIGKTGARIMGLDNPDNKMSKSAPSQKNFISLMDDEATVLKKMKSALTDSESTIVFNKDRKGLANLMTIYSLVTGKSTDEIEKMYKDKGYGDFKTDLAEHVSSYLKPLQEKITELLKDEKALIKTLEDGAKKAEKLAEKKMKDVRKKIGVTL
jgi:tryptophanyl-tRNA synthetase